MEGANVARSWAIVRQSEYSGEFNCEEPTLTFIYYKPHGGQAAERLRDQISQFTQEKNMQLNRRNLMTTTAAVAVGALAKSVGAVEQVQAPAGVRFCMNTSTLQGQKLPLDEIVDLVSTVGYSGIEPWIREIQAYKESGKSLADLKKRIADGGLLVESAIGFSRWIVDDETERKQGLEDMKRDMEMVAAIGGTRIAAPPVGMHGQDAANVDLFKAAERYHALLELGREMGVTPQVEIWGPSKNLSRLGEAVFVAVESGHPDACVLPDVYHIYRGGSSFEGLGLLGSNTIHCFHFNDYPTAAERTLLNDSDRVYPGDGVAPWKEIIGILQSIGFQGAASLELFNRDYWKQDAKVVAETGLKKMKAVFQIS